MAYRLPDKRRHFIVDKASESVIVVDNGTISRVSIPCTYGPPHCHPPKHDRKMHDHTGWPSPDNPDDSCQIPDEHRHCRCFDQVLVINEIDLAEEGYESVEISMLDQPDGLTVTGEIDYNVVRITIVSMCEAANEENVDVPFSIYVIGSKTVEDGETTKTLQLRDVVTKGILRIVAGPIS